MLGWQASLAGTCFSVGSQVQGLIALNHPNYVAQPYHATLLTIASVSLGILINIYFARKLPLIEGMVLILHVFGFFAVLIPLWIFAPRQPSTEVWSHFTQSSDWPTIGLALMVGLSCPVLALIGPDSAVHMCRS